MNEEKYDYKKLIEEIFIPKDTDKITLNKEIKDRLFKINWLSNCGRQDELDLSFEYTYIKRIKEIEKMLDGVKWGNTCMNARNDLTEFLSLHHSRKYNCWNQMVDEVKDDIISGISNIIIESCRKLGIPEKMGDHIYFDIINIALTYSYKEYYESVFYDDMLKIYESGHLPCGWLGKKYPNGKFKIY